MHVVFFRHATRGGLGPNPDLSPQGRKEAENLCKLLEPVGGLPEPTQLWSSPKRRAQQTLLPLAKYLEIEIQLRPELDEGGADESSLHLNERISALFRNLELQKPEEVIYLCTHSDWLELAMTALPSDMSEIEMSAPFACASYRVFELVDRILRTQQRTN